MKQDIIIVDYDAGNIRSVFFALERLGVSARLSRDPEVLDKADKVIFPGVGEASAAMAILHDRGLADCICHLRQPVLAICVGQQLICAHSEESDTPCLGLLPHRVLKFSDVDKKVPHMGWNQIYDLRGPLFKDIEEGSYVYFLHSYYVEQNMDETALCDYGETFAAALAKDNFLSTQFHPEKSGKVGAKIIQNFLKL